MRTFDDLVLKLNLDLWRPYCRIHTHLPTDIKQGAQLVLTNPRDTFRGQSRSPNIVPFHVFLLCNSNFVFNKKTCRFSDIRLQKYRDLEIRVEVTQGGTIR